MTNGGTGIVKELIIITIKPSFWVTNECPVKRAQSFSGSTTTAAKLKYQLAQTRYFNTCVFALTPESGTISRGTKLPTAKDDGAFFLLLSHTR